MREEYSRYDVRSVSKRSRCFYINIFVVTWNVFNTIFAYCVACVQVHVSFLIKNMLLVFLIKMMLQLCEFSFVTALNGKVANRNCVSYCILCYYWNVNRCNITSAFPWVSGASKNPVLTLLVIELGTIDEHVLTCKSRGNLPGYSRSIWPSAFAAFTRVSLCTQISKTGTCSVTVESIFAETRILSAFGIGNAKVWSGRSRGANFISLN